MKNTWSEKKTRNENYLQIYENMYEFIYIYWKYTFWTNNKNKNNNKKILTFSNWKIVLFILAVYLCLSVKKKNKIKF